MVEIWKDIKGYEGLYQVSNLGRVKSLRKNIIMKEALKEERYLSITLHKNKTRKSFYIHRLVAQAFVSNPNNYPEVNHKDENKQNNQMDNLEWCTPKYNANYGTRNKRLSELQKGNKYWLGKKHTRKTKEKISENHADFSREKHPNAKKVKCLNNNIIFQCLENACEWCNLKNSTSISAACKGKRKTAGKHPVTGERLRWEYVE